jgi:hypothetical protein
VNTNPSLLTFKGQTSKYVLVKLLGWKCLSPFTFGQPESLPWFRWSVTFSAFNFHMNEANHCIVVILTHFIPFIQSNNTLFLSHPFYYVAYHIINIYSIFLVFLYFSLFIHVLHNLFSCVIYKFLLEFLFIFI